MFRVEPVSEHLNILRMDDGKVNAIGPAFLEGFAKAWSDATRDNRAVVLAGNGKAFCAGLDLKTLPMLPPEELVAFTRGFISLFEDVMRYDRPVVAAIDGPALAGGAILAMCADFRLVGPRARLGLTEVPVGIPFPAPVVALARTVLPPPELAPALLLGNIRQGEPCVTTGWAHRFSPSETVVADATALATALAELPPVAYASAKRELLGECMRAFQAFTKEDCEAWVALLMSEDTMAGIMAAFARITATKQG